MTVYYYILIGVILVLCYIVYNLYNKYRILLKKYDEDILHLETSTINVYKFMLGIFTEGVARMRDIDRRGVFEKDDEVGYAFAVIKEAIEQIKFQLEKLTAEDENKK